MNHANQVRALLRTQIDHEDEVDDIFKAAEDVANRWVDPASGGNEQINGLIYGLVQSGKTGVLTATGAIGADLGYRTIIVLTSDINPLYKQTINRIREAFPGMDVLNKSDIRDSASFGLRLRGSACVIVATKNGRMLDALIQSLRECGVRGLSSLIIDDEADQASLNTKAARDDGTQSKINERIVTLRSFFHKNTYLQVTATPQALFLQDPTHDFRPQFTVLSHPGSGYVGGDDFFGENSPLIRMFPLSDLNSLTTGGQPSPGLHPPASLTAALDTFMIGATHKRQEDPRNNCAFLCHVSTRTADHRYIEILLRKYKQDLIDGLQTGSEPLLNRLRTAYDDLCATHEPLKASSFDELISSLAFFLPSAAVKLVNGLTDEDVAVLAPYNLFVGGNKLGRGVTIKNLLVSYYGRNPKRPQADTVLQHARMYGYRRSDLGLLRLFVPPVLNSVFQAIHRMETGLRSLINESPDEEFRGVFVEGAVKPTRKNILAPGAVGAYTGGSSYNPAQVYRDKSVIRASARTDAMVAGVNNRSYSEMPIGQIVELIRLSKPDPSSAQHIWNTEAICGSVSQYAKLHDQLTGYVYVARGRKLRESRRETQGILEGGEAGLVPIDKLTLFLLQIEPKPGENAAWWPQIRFPRGRYAFAFAI